LNSKIHEMTQARETIVAQLKELEVGRQAQSEVETLRKELAEARQALTLKEADSAQLKDFNGWLNDELAMLMSERKWLLKERVPLVTEAVRDSKEMCDRSTISATFRVISTVWLRDGG
jgi:(p)ppGpp synthase/HD superfamily hydrolase